LEPGQNIVIRGALTGDKFDINLSVGPDMVYRKHSGDDVALHINYSRGSREIILNTFQQGSWLQEQRENGSLIREQASFELRIFVHPDRFEIFLDNIKLADYAHRIPFNAVQYLYIVDGITLQSVDVGSRGQRQTRDTKVLVNEKLDPSVLTPGNAIVIRGTPTGGNFSINLSVGPDMVYQKHTGDEVALHINYSGGSRRLILNSFEKGYWQNEEQYDAPSINQGVVFELRIEIHSDRFVILLDNQKLADFSYRVSLDKIQYIYIVDDIKVDSLNTGAKAPTQPPAPADTPQPPSDVTGPAAETKELV